MNIESRLLSLDDNLSLHEQIRRASLFRIFCFNAGFNISEVNRIISNIQGPSIFKHWANERNHYINIGQENRWREIALFLIKGDEGHTLEATPSELALSRYKYKVGAIASLNNCLNLVIKNH